MKQVFALGFLDAVFFFFSAIVLTNCYGRKHDRRTPSQQQLLEKEMPAGVHETKQPLGMVHHLLCQWCLKKIIKKILVLHSLWYASYQK